VAYWLVYVRCDECEKASCLICHREDRSLTLHVVEAEEMPAASLNGPCDSPEGILKRIGQYFNFDEFGKMYFKVEL
jgi:hypothetical protein